MYTFVVYVDDWLLCVSYQDLEMGWSTGSFEAIFQIVSHISISWT